jgi:hypothetical protein
MRWATHQGVVAGLSVHHAAVSKRFECEGAWHYHCHALLEFPAGRFSVEATEAQGKKFESSPELAAKWVSIAAAVGEDVLPMYNRLVLAAGGPIEGLRDDRADTDFWSESRDLVARLVQYPMRDLAQGITAFKLGSSPHVAAERIDELCRSSRGWKMRRAWGRWRKKCPAHAEALKKEAAEAAEKSGTSTPPAAQPLGTMRRVFFAARAGNAWAVEALKGLEASTRNNTRFCKRLVAWVRAAIGGKERDGP